MDKAYITQTLQKLVQINSVNPSLETDGKGEVEIGSFIAEELKKFGIKPIIDEIVPGRINVTGIIKGSGTAPATVLNAHMDTVGVKGMSDPFSGEIKNGNLYGRGAFDMKGSIAAILGVAKSLYETAQKPNGDVILSFVADEEYESIGATHFLTKYKADQAIVTEPSGLNICLAHRGFGIFNIMTTGKTAHGGKHREGIDANTLMGLLLAEIYPYANSLPELKKHELCGEASAHVPIIKGGNSLFIYSNSCEIHLERRTIPGELLKDVEKEILALINKVNDKHPEFNAAVTCELWRNPHEIHREKPLVQSLERATKKALGFIPPFTGHGWWEDTALFAEAGIDTLTFGPKGGGIHQAVEWVEIDSVVKLAHVLWEVILD